jgi:hypothetical protein
MSVAETNVGLLGLARLESPLFVQPKGVSDGHSSSLMFHPLRRRRSRNPGECDLRCGCCIIEAIAATW